MLDSIETVIRQTARETVQEASKNPLIPLREYLTPGEACVWLSCRRKHLETLRAKKIGPKYTRWGRFIRYRIEDLQAFLDSHPLHFLYGGENAYTVKEYITAISLGGIEIKTVLNPLQSNINLYPESLESVKKMIEAKFNQFH